MPILPALVKPKLDFRAVWESPREPVLGFRTSGHGSSPFQPSGGAGAFTPPRRTVRPLLSCIVVTAATVAISPAGKSQAKPPGAPNATALARLTTKRATVAMGS
jgi:hypothetical protein